MEEEGRMLAVFLALSLVTPQGAIDFDHAGAPVARVVAALGEAYGVECYADGSLDRDFVILALRGEPFERARSLLAKALNATWTEKDGRWRFHRTPEQTQEDKEREVREKIERYAWAQPYVQVPNRITGERAEEFVRLLVQHAASGGSSFPQELAPQTPLSRAQARIRKELDPSIVRTLNSGATMFGVRASALVQKMPANVEAILREAFADQNALYQLMNSRAASLPGYLTLTRVGRLEDVYLIVIPNEFGPIVELIVPHMDGGGLMHFHDLSTVSNAPALNREWPESLNVECKLSELTLELSALPPVRFAPDSLRAQPSGQLLQVFTDTRTRDPLELSWSEAALQASIAEKASYVVVPRDDIPSSRFQMMPKWKVHEVMGLIYRPYVYEVERDADAVIVRPLKPNEAREERTDRQAFARALLAVRSRSADLVGHLADAVKGLSSDSVSRVLGQMSQLGRIYTYNCGEPEVLLIYAELTDAQRRAAASGGVAVPFVGAFRERLSILAALKVRSPMAGHINLDSILDRTTADLSAEAVSVARADGDSQFVLRRQQIHMLYQTNRYRGNYGPAYPTTPENLARLERNSAQDPEFDWSSMLFRTVQQDTLVLSLARGGAEAPVAAFKVPALYEGDKFEPMEKMPDWVRERYEAERKRLATIPPDVDSDLQ